MIKKIKAVFINPENGKKTEDCIILELQVTKDRPNFKEKSEVFGYMKTTDEDSGELGMYPWVGVHTNNYLLVDFGDTFNDYSKELLETPTKPKFGRYLHILTKDLNLKVGQNILISYSGETHPYSITRIEDYK